MGRTIYHGFINKTECSWTRKDGFLTGVTKALNEDDPTFPKREVENSTIMSWLINWIEADFRQLYLFFPTAKDIWDVARYTYSHLGNSTSVF